MTVKYFNDEGKELFPKYNYNSDVYYLDTTFKRPVIYHIKSGRIIDIKPCGLNDFQYQIEIPGFWCSKFWWVDEEHLFENKQEAFDKAIRLYQESKIKYKVVY